MTPHKVKIDPIVEKSEIILHPTKTTNKGLVLEVGEGCEVKVGDKVIFSSRPLSKFNKEDGVYDFIFEEEILAIIE